MRPARRGDSEALAVLLRELGYAEGTDSSTVNWVISHPEIEIHVAGDAQDRPIGMLSFSHRPQLRLGGRIITIEELIVTESWRGKGVGRALLKQAVLRAKMLSAKRVELNTHGKPDEGVETFCARCGFEASGAAVFSLKP